MSSIRQLGIVIQEYKGNTYEVVLDENPEHKVMATLCGKMQESRINLVAGDTVTVELSPYDLTRGRIVWRHA